MEPCLSQIVFRSSSSESKQSPPMISPSQVKHAFSDAGVGLKMVQGEDKSVHRSLSYSSLTQMLAEITPLRSIKFADDVSPSEVTPPPSIEDDVSRSDENDENTSLTRSSSSGDEGIESPFSCDVEKRIHTLEMRGSPRRRLAAWIVGHPELGEEDKWKETLLQMPISRKMREFIVAHLYKVPAEGLFSVQVESKAEKGFPRPDLVRFLLRHQKFRVLQLHSLRRYGKTFSIPWALVEAWKQVKGRRPMVLFYYDFTASETSKVLPFECILACLSFLQIPCVFDEYTSSKNLTYAIKQLITMELSSVVTLLPLHFILLSSLQSPHLSSHATGLVGHQSRRVSMNLLLPHPPLWLLASIYESKGGGDFSGLLQRLMMCGRDLDAHHNTEIDVTDMKDPFKSLGLRDTFEAVIVGLSRTSKVPDGLLHAAQSLEGHELIQQRPFQNDWYDLQEFRLLFLKEMKGKKTASSKEAAVMTLEGKVLEILVRMDLMSVVLSNIGLPDQAETSLFWGCVGSAELDAGALVGEIMVLISCKRDDGKQKFSKVLCSHLLKFAEHVNSGFAKFKANKGKGLEKDKGKMYDDSHVMKWRNQYIYENPAAQYLDAVKIAVHFVGVSIHASKFAVEVGKDVPSSILLDCLGEKRSLPITYHTMVVDELIEPYKVQPEALIACSRV